MSEYKPDGKCGTCRHLHHSRTGDGFHEPLDYDQECGVEDELVQIGQIRENVSADYDGVDGCGDTKPCPLYLPLAQCEKHGKMETGEFGCPSCDDEAYAEMADQLKEEEALAAEWRRENGLP